MDNDDAMAGGHPECLEEKNSRRMNSLCLKCNKPVNDDIVYHEWCTVYSGYAVPA